MPEMSLVPPAFHAIHAHGSAAANRSKDIRATVGDLLKAALEDCGFQRAAVMSAVFAAGSGLDAMFPASLYPEIAARMGPGADDLIKPAAAPRRPGVVSRTPLLAGPDLSR
jgi:hypothetical protein